MASVSTLILEQLDELLEDDFESFKFHLKKNVAHGFDHIPRSKLEKARRHYVVELMVDHYKPRQAANITVQILNRIRQNQLARELEEKLKGQVQAADVDGASSSSSSSPAVGVVQNISAEQTSNVVAPVQSGGNYYGPVTLNFNTPK